jgi:hypothetical protein
VSDKALELAAVIAMPEREAFLSERAGLARRAKKLISESENDGDVESAIQFALAAMHDDDSKVAMLDWVCENRWEIDGRFIGVQGQLDDACGDEMTMLNPPLTIKPCPK